MKFQYNPSEEEIRNRRRHEFQSMDGDLLDALVKFVLSTGAELPPELNGIIEKRERIKTSLPKPSA